MDWVDYPIDSGVTTDTFMLGIDKNDFEVLISGILIDPVGVEDAEIGAAASDSLFGCGFERSLVLELVDTLVCGFAWELIPLNSSLRERQRS